jgi:hypothetical protein
MERLVRLIQGEEPPIGPSEEEELATARDAVNSNGAVPSDRQPPVEEDEDNLIEEI